MSNLLELLQRIPATGESTIDKPKHFIGELARKFALSPQTIRFYEDEGLIAPNRFGRFRIYTPRDEHRVEMIVACRKMGLPIHRIREVLSHTGEGSSTNRKAIAHICTLHLDELKQRLGALEAEIVATEQAVAGLSVD